MKWLIYAMMALILALVLIMAVDFVSGNTHTFNGVVRQCVYKPDWVQVVVYYDDKGNPYTSAIYHPEQWRVLGTASGKAFDVDVGRDRYARMPAGTEVWVKFRKGGLTGSWYELDVNLPSSKVE